MFCKVINFHHYCPKSITSTWLKTLNKSPQNLARHINLFFHIFFYSIFYRRRKSSYHLTTPSHLPWRVQRRSLIGLKPWFLLQVSHFIVFFFRTFLMFMGIYWDEKEWRSQGVWKETWHKTAQREWKQILRHDAASVLLFRLSHG